MDIRVKKRFVKIRSNSCSKKNIRNESNPNVITKVTEAEASYFFTKKTERR